MFIHQLHYRNLLLTGLDHISCAILRNISIQLRPQSSSRLSHSVIVQVWTRCVVAARVHPNRAHASSLSGAAETEGNKKLNKDLAEARLRLTMLLDYHRHLPVKLFLWLHFCLGFNVFMLLHRWKLTRTLQPCSHRSASLGLEVVRLEVFACDSRKVGERWSVRKLQETLLKWFLFHAKCLQDTALHLLHYGR